MIKFNSIEITNFLSIEFLEFNFLPGRHIILGKNMDSTVASSNGAGKSSLIEAISFVLYRDYPRKDVCRRGQKECKVVLDVDIDNHKYIITKSITGSKTNLEINLDGENVTARGVRQIEKDIVSAIGLPYTLFTSSVIIPQGYPVNISQMTPTARKSIIESLLGLLVWEDYQTIFTAVAKEHEGKRLAVSSQFDEKKEKMVSLYNYIKGLKEFSEEHLAELKAKIGAVKADIKNCSNETAEINAAIQEISEKSLDDLNTESMNAAYKINQLNNKVKEISISLQRGECYSCHRPYSEEEQAKMTEEKATLSRKIDKYQVTSDSLRQIVAKVQELINKRKDIFYQSEMKKRELKSLTDSYMKHKENDQIPTLEADLEALNEEVNSVKDELSDMERDKNSLTFICQSLLPSSKFRTKLVNSYIQVLNQIIEEVVSLIFPEMQLQLTSSSNEAGIDISILDREGHPINYYSLSGGEKRRIDVILTLSIQKFLLESSFTNSSILVFDEIFDNLDATASNIVLSAINNLFGEEKAIYVISHNDSIKSMFESSITAEKTSGITYYDLSNYNEQV